MTPKDHSTAGKTRLGVITRCEACWSLERTALIQQVRRGRGHPSPCWSSPSSASRPNLPLSRWPTKTARIAWKLIVSGKRYNHARQPPKIASRDGRSAPLCEGAALRPLLTPRTTSPEKGTAMINARVQWGDEHRLSLRPELAEKETRDAPWNPAVLDIALLFGTHVAKTILASGHVRPPMMASDPVRTLPTLASGGLRPHMDSRRAALMLPDLG